MPSHYPDLDQQNRQAFTQHAQHAPVQAHSQVPENDNAEYENYNVDSVNPMPYSQNRNAMHGTTHNVDTVSSNDNAEYENYNVDSQAPTQYTNSYGNQGYPVRGRPVPQRVSCIYEGEEDEPLLNGNGNQQQNQQITVHPAAPNYGENTNTGQDPTDLYKGVIPTAEDRFPAKEKWVDTHWAVIFIIHSIAFFGIAIWKTIDGYNHNSVNFTVADKHGDTFYLDGASCAKFIAISLAVGVVVAALILFLSIHFAKQLIWGGMFLQIALCGAMVGFGIYSQSYYTAAIGGLLMIVIIIFAFLLRNSIALAGALLDGAGVAVRKNWGMLVMVSGHLFHVAIVAGSFFILAAGCMACFSDNSATKSTGFGFFLLIWGLFALLWIDWTAKNVLHCVSSGSCARLFYLGEDRQGPQPTMQSFKLATTKYLGASCFGSFLMALIQWMKIMAESAKNQNQKNGNIAGAILACLCLCILNIFEDIFRIVNSYALVYVSMYGNKFWTSGKMVWKLAKATRLEPLFNDYALNLYKNSCSFLAFILSGAILCLLSYLRAPVPDIFGKYVCVQDILMWLAGMSLCMMFTRGVIQPMDSGCRTLLVMFCECPAYFYKSQPMIYAKVRDRAAKMGLVSGAKAHFVY